MSSEKLTPQLDSETVQNLVNIFSGQTFRNLSELHGSLETQLTEAQETIRRINEGPTDEIIKALREILSIGRIAAIAELPHLGQLLNSAQPAHQNFPLVEACLQADVPIWLHGEAGSGKSTTGERAADALGLPFRSISLGPTTSKSDLLGYRDANGNYQGTAFRNCYEDGGVFLFDEIDNAHPSILTLMNSSIANGNSEFPDARVPRHQSSRFIATANTIGKGATAEYVGRTPIDAATIDRFAFIRMDTDPILEESIVLGTAPAQDEIDIAEGGVPTPAEWLRTVRSFRNATKELGLRALISQRASIFGSRLAGVGVGQTYLEDMLIYKGMRPEDKDRLKELSDRLHSTIKTPGPIDLDDIPLSLESIGSAPPRGQLARILERLEREES